MSRCRSHQRQTTPLNHSPHTAQVHERQEQDWASWAWIHGMSFVKLAIMLSLVARNSRDVQNNNMTTDGSSSSSQRTLIPVVLVGDPSIGEAHHRCLPIPIDSIKQNTSMSWPASLLAISFEIDLEFQTYLCCNWSKKFLVDHKLKLVVICFKTCIFVLLDVISRSDIIGEAK